MRQADGLNDGLVTIDYAANVILNLFLYIPNIINRMKSLLRDREFNVPEIYDKITIDLIEMAIDVLEQDLPLEDDF